MEVIGHDAVRDDLEAAESGVFAHVLEELFFFVITEEELAVHNAGDAVIKGVLVILRSFKLPGIIWERTQARIAVRP